MTQGAAGLSKAGTALLVAHRGVRFLPRSQELEHCLLLLQLRGHNEAKGVSKRLKGSVEWARLSKGQVLGAGGKDV